MLEDALTVEGVVMTTPVQVVARHAPSWMAHKKEASSFQVVAMDHELELEE